MVTGLNKAFIIGNETKEALIREDPRSAELLKPVVRGRDIHPYRVAWAGLWLIATFPAARINIDDYPAIRRWLSSFGPRLHQTGEKLSSGVRARKKTPHAWWELQDTCAYYEKFQQPTIMWRAMSDRPQFTYSMPGVFCNAKAFVLSCDELSRDDDKRCLLYYLVGVMNSALVGWYGRKVASTTGAGRLQWLKFSISSLCRNRNLMCLEKLRLVSHGLLRTSSGRIPMTRRTRREGTFPHTT